MISYLNLNKKNETNCMIRDFYASIGKEMDFSANNIAMSYLKRSAEQGYHLAELELSRLVKSVCVSSC